MKGGEYQYSFNISPPGNAQNTSNTTTTTITIGGKVMWETFQKSFSQVQTILDQDRVLIREINQNQESKIPENLSRNVGLIRELNANIARVVELYANLSSEFVQSMEGEGEEAKRKEGEGEGEEGRREVVATQKAKIVDTNSLPPITQKKPRYG